MNERSASGLLPDSAPPADLVLSKLDALPTLAPVAIKLLEVTSDDRSSAADVIALIQGDPVLTAKLLRISNAAGGGARVKSIDQAVVLLGFATIRTTVLTVKIFECFESSGRGLGQTLRRQRRCHRDVGPPSRSRSRSQVRSQKLAYQNGLARYWSESVKQLCSGPSPLAAFAVTPFGRF